MPKSNLRYKHVNRNCGLDACQSSFPPSEQLLCAPPRKVSFEDKRNDSDVSISSNEIVPKNNCVISEAAKPEQERKSLRRKRSLLVRPTTSLSLVDLAKSVEQDGGNPIEQCEESKEDMMEERNPKRIRSFDISPRSILTHASGISGNSRGLSPSMQPVSPLGESASIRISPWGYFVDTTPSEDDYIDLPTTPYQTHNYIVKCNKSRSWRRHSPYGDYKTIIKRIEQTQPTLSFAGIQRNHSIESKRKFRLSPRNKNSTQDRSTDGNDLAGVFSELQVRHDVM